MVPADTADQPSLDPTDLGPVLAPEGWALLNRLSAEGSYREADALSLSTRLRKDGHAPELVSAVVARCTEVDSGARAIDNILTGTLLPEVAGQVLEKMSEGAQISTIKAGLTEDGRFEYEVA